jgi:very-short-patch-repair endonuclease
LGVSGDLSSLHNYQHGLPLAQRQARREIAGKVHYRDNWYADYRVCVELDGPSFHRDEQVWTDKRRDNLNLAEDGAETFRFGPVEVTELACESAAMVAATLYATIHALRSASPDG